jgi:large subunit ribosomal protein L9
MKVYLLKNVEGVGMAREIIKVSDGYAQNFLLPNKLAVQVTPANEKFYQTQIRNIENRKEAIVSETSRLAEDIKTAKNLVLKRKTHDGSKLYASVNPLEIAELFTKQNMAVSKSQVHFDKAIKSTGSYDVIIKLSSRLQPVVKIKVVSE